MRSCNEIENAKARLNRNFEKHDHDDDFLSKLESYILEGFESNNYSRVCVESTEHLTKNEFIENYESLSIPLLIRNSTQDWPALINWNFDTLEKDFSQYEFMCGEDEQTYEPIMITMGNFLNYMKTNLDNNPLYLFDSTFYFDPICKRILKDFSVPQYFPTNPDQKFSSSLLPSPPPLPPLLSSSSSSSSSPSPSPSSSSSSLSSSSPSTLPLNEMHYDLLSYLGETRRPPYRWFLIGPQRSGSAVHKDPFGTSAWNTVVHGRKLWLLFPPETLEIIVKDIENENDDEDDEVELNILEPIHYFMSILPKLRRKHPTISIYLTFQESGDTMFVPSGWWHSVINLTDTIAITQNYCSWINFKTVFNEMNDDAAYDKERAMIWKQTLQEIFPQEVANWG